MINKIIPLLCLLFLSGCYTTAPTHWSVHSKRYLVDQSQPLQNGTRLELSRESDRNSLIVRAQEYPQCRTVERGRIQVEEQGLQESHGWPGALAGVVMMGGGAGLIYDGFSQKDSTRQLVEGLGGIGVAALGAVVFGKCSLSINGCGPDEEMESKTYIEGPFHRWRPDSEREKCSSGTAKLSANVRLTVEATFANTKRSISWSGETSSDGTARFNMLSIASAVAAHCGKSTLFIYSDPEQKFSEDNPDRPDMSRDNRAIIKVGLSGGSVRAPSEIKDPQAFLLADECAREAKKKCLGIRTQSFEDVCSKKCDTLAGAGICKLDLDANLSAPNLTGEDRQSFQVIYEKCVKDHNVGDSSTQTCKSSCFDEMAREICPDPW